jgi:hypothetical protein
MLPRPARLCRPRRSPRPAHPRKPRLLDVGRRIPARDRFAPDSPLEGSGFELPVPREIALRSRSGLALHPGSLALRRCGPDWNGRPTAEAWVSHREEIPRPHPSALTASPAAMFSDPVRLCRLVARPPHPEKPGRCRRVSTGDIERILRQAWRGDSDLPVGRERARAHRPRLSPIGSPSDNHVVRFRAWVQDCQTIWR